MTEKELHRLRRQDLLQLLLSQGKEALALQAKLNDTSSALVQTRADYDRLKEKLDEKDAVIEKLKGRLDDKDARISELETEMEAFRLSRKIQIEEAGSLAEAVLRLNGVFETAQKAADQYIYNLQRMNGERAGHFCRKETIYPEPGEGALSTEGEGFHEPEYGLPEAKKEEEPRSADV